MIASVALLRAVNVGGHNIIPMAGLRALCESLDWSDVQTLVQSGNVVFRCRNNDPSRLCKSLGDAIEKKFDFRPEVVMRTCAELRGVVARNPFAKKKDIDPRKLMVVFLASQPSAEATAKVKQIKVGPEELRIDGRELYIYYPDGAGKSKLSNTLLERTLQTAGTARNWNTVTRLLEMAEALV
jgi:uncharacterized protein (DUF1697 family)